MEYRETHKNGFETKGVSEAAENFITEAFRETNGLYGHALNCWQTNYSVFQSPKWRKMIAEIPLYSEIIEKQHALPAERELVMHMSNKEMVNRYDTLARDFNAKLPDIMSSADEEAKAEVEKYLKEAKTLIMRTAE